MTSRSEIPRSYKCPKCGKDHTFPAYVYAHFDESIVHTCECGEKNEIIKGKLIPKETKNHGKK